MLNPIFQETDVIRKGDTYLRQYNTGTLDTTVMIPRARLIRRRDGVTIAPVQMGHLALEDEVVDPYNWALVIPYEVTNLLDLTTVYIVNVSFDDGLGNSIPHGVITLTVEQGEAHE